MTVMHGVSNELQSAEDRRGGLADVRQTLCLFERVVNVFTQEPCASERSPDFVRWFWAKPRGAVPAF